MDKVGLRHRISALSRYFYAGQRLREPGMDRGQKFGDCQKPGFCTSDAVDIQDLVHRTSVPESWSPVSDAGLKSEMTSNFLRLRSFFCKTLVNAVQSSSCPKIPGVRVMQFVYLKACIQNSSNSKRAKSCG